MKKILSVLIALLLLCTIVMAQPMEKNTIARRYSNIVALDAGIIKNGSSVSCRDVSYTHLDVYKRQNEVRLGCKRQPSQSPNREAIISLLGTL